MGVHTLEWLGGWVGSPPVLAAHCTGHAEHVPTKHGEEPGRGVSPPSTAPLLDPVDANALFTPAQLLKTPQP